MDKKPLIEIKDLVKNLEVLQLLMVFHLMYILEKFMLY